MLSTLSSACVAIRSFSTSTAAQARRTRAATAQTPRPVPAARPRLARDFPPSPSARPIPHLTLQHGGSYSHLFQVRTRWIASALAEGFTVPKHLLYKLVESRKISPGHLALWVDILHRRDPIYALEHLGLLESASAADEVRSSSEEGPATADEPCPDWLYLAIPAMVTSHHHVPYLASQLVSDRYTQLDERKRSVFLARCIEHFLKVHHYVAVRETVEFIAFTEPVRRRDAKSGKTKEVDGRGDGSIWREQSFARVLEALSSERSRVGRHSTAPRELIHALRDLVLDTMRRRNVPRSSVKTWLPLFSPKLVPVDDPDLARRWLDDMARVGVDPKRKVLRQVLKVWVKHAEQEGIADGEREQRTQVVARLFDEIERAGKKNSASRQIEERAGDETPSRAEKASKGIVSSGSEDPVGGRDRTGGTDATSGIVTAQRVAVDAEATGETLKRNADAVVLRSNATTARNRLDSNPVRAELAQGPSRRRALAAHRPGAPVNDIDRTMLVRRSTALPYFETLRTFLSTRGRRRDFPPPPFPSNAVSWSALFQTVAGETTTIDADFLIAVLKAMELASTRLSSPCERFVPPRPTIRIYSIVMQSLLLRNAPRRVISLHTSLEARGYQPDSTVIDLVVRACLDLGDLSGALRIIKFYQWLPSRHARDLIVSPRTRPHTRSTLVEEERGPPVRDQAIRRRPNSVRLDVVPFNSILSYIARQGLYDRVWALYRTLESTYEVRPDEATIAIMLGAARAASQAAGRGTGFGLKELDEIPMTLAQPPSTGSLAETMMETSASSPGRRRARRDQGVVNDKWDEVPAARRMERFVWDELLTGNWQELDLINPLVSSRPFGASAGGRGVSSWLSAAFARPGSTLAISEASALARPVDWRPFVSTLSPAPPLYPDIYPTDPVLRSLILLTAVHSHVRLIGLVLAWARTAHVEPSRWTLCLALLHIEGDAAIPRNKVETLRRWLQDWLGKDKVPTDDEIAWARRGGRVQGRPQVL
ncbi:hypothetical protein JCM10212_003071 [Sporobolomyces blumeae]